MASSGTQAARLENFRAALADRVVAGEVGHADLKAEDFVPDLKAAFNEESDQRGVGVRNVKTILTILALARAQRSPASFVVGMLVGRRIRSHLQAEPEFLTRLCLTNASLLPTQQPDGAEVEVCGKNAGMNEEAEIMPNPC